MKKSKAPAPKKTATAKPAVKTVKKVAAKKAAPKSASKSAPKSGGRGKASILVYGAGKVGRALGRELARAGYPVTVRAARAGLPKKPFDAKVVIVSVRDRDLPTLADEMAERELLREDAVVLHNAGALGAEALTALRAFTAGVAQFHPMISFASKTYSPTLARGNAHIQGDPAAVRVARELATALGLTARTFVGLDTVGYHASAGLVANGAAALASIGAELLVRSGVPANLAPKLLGPLLRSVAENVEHLGFPDALTGPVRRGDAGSIHKQIALLRQKLPAALPLFIASVAAQLPLAKRLGEAPPEAFEAIADGVRWELSALTN